MPNALTPTAPQMAPAPSAPSLAYVAPAIETVITSDELQREVLYAGTPVSFVGPPIPIGL